MFKNEDFSAGDEVTTPSGRRAVVKKMLIGTSKFDHFSRVVCQYVGGGPKDLVTLQPHQLRLAPTQPVQQTGMASPDQMALNFT